MHSWCKKLVLLLICITILSIPVYAHNTIQTSKERVIINAIDYYYIYGFETNSEPIQILLQMQQEEQLNLSILAKVIKNEAPGTPEVGQWCPIWHQQAAAQVVVNRALLPNFPNTIYEVVAQQLPSGYYAYNPRYCYDFYEIEDHYYEIARQVLDEECADIPKDLIYQDNQPHGEIWKISYIDTGYYSSITYFCKA